MAKFFGNLNAVLLAGLVLLLIVIFGIQGEAVSGDYYLSGLLRFLHVLLGIMWIGLLYYFNFVQIPTMPNVPAELKPAVSKHIAPAALFWFRWSALLTVILGAGLASTPPDSYLVDALTFRENYRVIGLGMWLGLIMAFNVWFVIWPNQKRALGIVEADDAAKAKSATTAMMFSRINTMLSIPMLYCMVSHMHIGEA
ncbi:MAG: urate hydroxylase PuuD [Sphingomonadaceae bacterium]|nr:urate hydroxylase PuuD [Sphingomonadaceae bacterium]